MLSLPVLHVIGLELKRIVVFRSIPHHHRKIVSFTSKMLVRPLSILCLVNCYCFRHLLIHLEWVGVVGQSVSIVVVATLLLNAEILGLGKGEHARLVRLLTHKLVRVVGKFMCFQVEHRNPVFACF